MEKSKSETGKKKAITFDGPYGRQTVHVEVIEQEPKEPQTIYLQVIENPEPRPLWLWQYGGTERYSFKQSFKCPVCGRDFHDYGNSPEPLASSELRCCDKCSREFVHPARHALARAHRDAWKRFVNVQEKKFEAEWEEAKGYAWEAQCSAEPLAAREEIDWEEFALRYDENKGDEWREWMRDAEEEFDMLWADQEAELLDEIREQVFVTA